MTRHDHTYNFARLSVLGANVSANKESFLLTALEARVYVEERGFRYMAVSTAAIAHRNERFISGVLVKYKPSLTEEVVDETNQEIVDAELPYGMVASSKYFIHISSGVVAYRPIASRISDNQFRAHLGGLINQGHQSFFVNASVESIDEDVKIENSLSLFQRIRKVVSTVWPTNPTNREVYRKLDDRLKLLNAARERRVLTANRDGLNIDELRNDDAFNAIHLAADGYGSASIHGTAQDGSDLVVRTDKMQITARVQDDEDPKVLLDQLFETFVRIWDRTRHGS